MNDVPKCPDYLDCFFFGVFVAFGVVNVPEVQHAVYSLADLALNDILRAHADVFEGQHQNF